MNETIVPISSGTLEEWNRWRGGVDQKFDTIIENQRVNKEILQEIKVSTALQAKATNFARGAMWVVWPLMAFMALMLLNHVINHSSASIPIEQHQQVKP